MRRDAVCPESATPASLPGRPGAAAPAVDTVSQPVISRIATSRTRDDSACRLLFRLEKGAQFGLVGLVEALLAMLRLQFVDPL